MLDAINLAHPALTLKSRHPFQFSKERRLVLVVRLSITEAVKEFYGVRAITGRYQTGITKGSQKQCLSTRPQGRRSATTGHGVTPSRQGSLDCFCGLYSLVNAIVYLHGPRVRRTQLLQALIAEYSIQWDVVELMFEGMDTEQMDHLIDEVLKGTIYGGLYTIDVEKPFARSKKLRIQGAIDRMQRFLANQDDQNRRIILISTGMHWTLVYHIDDKYLYWFDSCGQQKSFRSSYSFRSGRGGHVLHRKAIYFLVRAEGERL